MYRAVQASRKLQDLVTRVARYCPRPAINANSQRVRFTRGHSRVNGRGWKLSMEEGKAFAG